MACPAGGEESLESVEMVETVESVVSEESVEVVESEEGQVRPHWTGAQVFAALCHVLDTGRSRARQWAVQPIRSVLPARPAAIRRGAARAPGRRRDTLGTK